MVLNHVFCVSDFGTQIWIVKSRRLSSVHIATARRRNVSRGGDQG